MSNNNLPARPGPEVQCESPECRQAKDILRNEIIRLRQELNQYIDANARLRDEKNELADKNTTLEAKVQRLSTRGGLNTERVRLTDDVLSIFNFHLPFTYRNGPKCFVHCPLNHLRPPTLKCTCSAARKKT